jgi:hypothetical protein
MAISNLTKSVSMSANSVTEVDGEEKIVLFMTGQKSTNTVPDFHFSIKDEELYADTAIRKQAKKDFSDFCDMVEDS